MGFLLWLGRKSKGMKRWETMKLLLKSEFGPEMLLATMSVCSSSQVGCNGQ